MSFIPDIREPVINTLYKGTAGADAVDGKENPYFQGFLNDNDANFLAGFDWIVEEVLTSFLYNLDVCEDELQECGFEAENQGDFYEILNQFLEQEETDSPMDLTQLDNDKIALILALYRGFRKWAECERDELGTSMIEAMSEEEYEECRERSKAGYKNAVTKEAETEQKN